MVVLHKKENKATVRYWSKNRSTHKAEGVNIYIFKDLTQTDRYEKNMLKSP